VQDLTGITALTRSACHVEAGQREENQQRAYRGGWDPVLVHHGVTIAIQVTGMINPWGKVILGTVERRIGVQRWERGRNAQKRREKYTW